MYAYLLIIHLKNLTNNFHEKKLLSCMFLLQLLLLSRKIKGKNLSCLTMCSCCTFIYLSNLSASSSSSSLNSTSPTKIPVKIVLADFLLCVRACTREKDKNPGKITVSPSSPVTTFVFLFLSIHF